jgi:hypothetical protein
MQITVSSPLYILAAFVGVGLLVVAVKDAPSFIRAIKGWFHRDD